MVLQIQSNNKLVVLILFSLLICSCNTSNYWSGHIEQHQNESSSSKKDPTFYFILGFFSIFVAVALLCSMARRRAITVYQLEEAIMKKCTRVNSLEVNPNTNNQLIYINGRKFIYIIFKGETTTNDFIIDAAFGLALKDCVKLNRVVELYQKVRKAGEQDEINYSEEIQDWSPNVDPIQGEGYFKKEETQINQNVYLGGYLLSKSLVEKTIPKEIVPMNYDNAQAVANFYVDSMRFRNYYACGQYIYFQQNYGITTQHDMRVSFLAAYTGPTTVIAKQQNNTFIPFVIPNESDQLLVRDGNFENQQGMESIHANFCCSCYNQIKVFLNPPRIQINCIQESIITLDEIFQQIVLENSETTLLLPLAGFLFMTFGIWLIISRITWVISMSHFDEKEFAENSGNCVFLSFFISFPLCMLVTAIAWFCFYLKCAYLFILLSCIIGTFIYVMINI